MTLDRSGGTSAEAEAGVRATARVVGVQEGLVSIESLDEGRDSAPLVKNEVVLVCPRDSEERLKAEILRVRGRTAEAQVFEETRGVAVGDAVFQTGALLSATLGPGLLGQVY
ncbi:MAG TPA: hypothetical protein VE173_13615, partial [Longimicrobiales bacterium]|nr:hypothetical protein [Longimicrobiales bacterium]